MSTKDAEAAGRAAVEQNGQGLPPATTVTGGELVVDTLRALGVQHVFGIPGGQTLAIMDAIFDRPDIDFVTTRHEGAAACMADAVGRLTGRPGVCLATTGPGATNLITGVGGALRDSSPVLVITCNNRTADLGRDDAQNADHVAIFRPLSKWATLVTEPVAIPRAIHEAAIRATSGCPGPVVLDFARNALEATVQLDAPGLVYPSEAGSCIRQVPGQRMFADPALVQQAVEALLDAERPVIWIGNGVQLSGANEAVVGLAESMDIPIITTFNALGAVETSHPNVFGPLSRMGTTLSRRVIEGSDLRDRDREQPQRCLHEPLAAAAAGGDRPDRRRSLQPRRELSDEDARRRRRCARCRRAAGRGAGRGAESTRVLGQRARNGCASSASSRRRGGSRSTTSRCRPGRCTRLRSSRPFARRPRKAQSWSSTRATQGSGRTSGTFAGPGST